MTISAAERFCSSSSLMSVGIPRPLSTTEIELSVWITTLMSSQWPASASSTALSTTSNTMWCMPVPSEVSPMYMPGRLRTASRPFRTLMLSESYSFASGACFSASPTLDPHRHDDVLEFGLGGKAHKSAGRSIAEQAFDIAASHIVQHVEEVIHVETDVQRVALVADFQRFLGFFLLGIGRDDLEAAVGQHPAHAAEFLVRQDGRAQQRLAQRLARDGQLVLVANRDYARVVRELAVDQLRHQLDAAERERGLRGRQFDPHF